ncbi:MAG TPA: regulatory signaling modulator protein AmpE [Gammaproteobacteria bacterium]|nr:regulatory signaling modulator protein AmpE [Gammaproteobacteria bacterium]
MTLISALLGIAVDRLWTHLHQYRHYHYFLQYAEWVRERLPVSLHERLPGVLLVLLPLWLLTWWLQEWIDGWLFGLAGLLFYIVVFVYCLGPRDLAVDVDAFCDVCDSADGELRKRAAAKLLHGGELPEDEEECLRRVTEAVLEDASDRLFAVLLWFVLLGPLGAVMYRSTAVLYRHDGARGAVAGLYSLLVWLPARLLALSYALSGHFDAAMEGWREAHQHHPQGVDGSARVLALTGRGALGSDAEPHAGDYPGAPVRAAMRLVWRALTVWLVAISVLTLAGWAS